MELRHLRYFVAVAEEKHFGRAAERLFITQPPLSQQIRHLEEELGVKLLKRTTQKVELTEAGKVFLEEARTTLEHADRAISAARRVGRSEASRLELAFIASVASSILTPLLVAFKNAHPEVNVNLAFMRTSDQIPALQEGQIDAGFVRLPFSGQGLVLEEVARDRFVALLPPDHALAGQEKINLLDLKDAPFITTEPQASPDFQTVLLEMCAKAGFRPSIVQEAGNLQAVVTLVAAGMGVSLVPEGVAETAPPETHTREIDMEPTWSSMAIAYRRDNRSKTLSKFLSVLHTQLGR
ncbi:LysR substrate-binding domain-containing protein [Deinococcus cellulosilyticus]|uniref:LysR family transcriptional regulator n=1 Tax=Deinococcus cellulosilyticus (strain DSM 18568 / NBRC 106333 / KACC 11606 / 5516J-15) TaxID=1223518 RepID=A0A511NBD9_DEIC1|nr:LysR substrate-binding domain-containing protein [Deinococcus cellulosilyticus]GEM49876.1 LysR family transcriptional regulator [Deinococcus cellulosilyticus NBRC 106333 = KACC 11606]